MMTSFELASKPLEERKAIINKLIEEGDSGEFKRISVKQKAFTIVWWMGRTVPIKSRCSLPIRMEMRMVSIFIIPMWSSLILVRFQVRLSAIGLHPKFKRYLHQISRCLLFAVPHRD